MHREPSRNPDQRPLSADHTIARAHGGTKADRLLHEVCNKERGDGSRDHIRPAATGRAIEQPNTDTGPLGTRAMPWP
jgi:hypothetical protein